MVGLPSLAIILILGSGVRRPNPYRQEGLFDLEVCSYVMLKSNAPLLECPALGTYHCDRCLTLRGGEGVGGESGAGGEGGGVLKECMEPKL